MIVYTSGSTGKPKGALLHHHGVAAFAERQNRAWPLSRHCVLNYFPINHVGSLCDVSAPALVAGGTIVFLEKFEPLEALQAMERERVSLWGSVPSVFQLQLALAELDAINLSAVELIVWEGAAMAREAIAKLKKIVPRLATNYGMTEATSAITIVDPTDDLDVLANSVGFPMEGVHVRLVDEAGEPIEQANVVGEIEARSDLNMLGYWRQPEATAAALDSDGWLRTGDLAERRSDGRYRIIGRRKEMYKSGGYNVYPAEVEQMLRTHPDVDDSVVVSIADALWDEVGVAFIKTSSDSALPSDIRAFAQRNMANYKVPKHFVIKKSLPLLPIGKIDRAQLRTEAAALTAASIDLV